MISLYPTVLATYFFLGLAAGIPFTAVQPGGSLEKEKFSEADVSGDFKYLYETLKASHFDLYARRSREAYDRYYREERDSIDGPMSRLDVERLFMRYVAFGNIGHARIDFPVQSYTEYIQAGGTLLPFDIRVQEGRVFVTYNYSDIPALGSGKEIIALNGDAMEDWMEGVGRYISAERPYFTHSRLESMFPRLVWLKSGRIESFQVTIASHSGSETTVTVDSVPAMVLERRKGEREAFHHSRRAELVSDGVAYLRPGPFYATDASETLEGFEAFIDNAFRAFIEADAEDLIIDLRNNPGGDNSFSDRMIAWIADTPFRFASEYELKASVQTQKVLKELAAKELDGVSAQMLDTMLQHESGEQFMFDIPMVDPRSGATFSGRVWALINRHTYSNATTVGAIIQDYEFGTVLGEETSDLPTTYASSSQFTLPETGIVVTYPKAHFVRPNGNEELRGVVPDHPFECPIVPTEEDSVLRDVVAFIRAQDP